MRILDRHKVAYEILNYECDEFIDGLHTAELTGAPVEQTYKTLVMQGKSKAYYVFVVQIAEEVDLKGGSKSGRREIRRNDSCKRYYKDYRLCKRRLQPLGMKKQFPTILDKSMEQFDKIYISGGRIGTSMALSPADLAAVTGAAYADITAK